MKTLRFKTNLKCNGCIQAISPYMDNISGIKKWNVDLNAPDKTLEAEADDYVEPDIIEAVEKAGYKIERSR